MPEPEPESKSESETTYCRPPLAASGSIRLGHGSGGKMSADLIETVFLPQLGNEILNRLEDAAQLSLPSSSIAVSTDSYVVSPVFFPGGNIGSLAVHGTINDLAMSGARPLFLTAAFILEEGFGIDKLKEIVDSMAQACRQSNVQLIASDTKVVGKGACDKIFINSCGIGVIECKQAPMPSKARAGDQVILSGDLGRHGMAIMSCREGLELETDVISDSKSVYNEVQAIMTCCPDGAIHSLRDITRGGLSSVLNELACASNTGISIKEARLPLHPQVSAACELLGLDPLYVACEGRFLAIVNPEHARLVLSVLKDYSEHACIIGEVLSEHKGRVLLESKVGGKRIIDKLPGEQLPRIC